MMYTIILNEYIFHCLPCGEVERAERLLCIVKNGADTDKHKRFAVLRQRVLQQIRERGVAEGHVALLRGAGLDDVTQSRERLVDVLRLLEGLARGSGLIQTL